MIKKIAILSLVYLIAMVYVAQGEEHFGMPVYPGAKPDVASRKHCSNVDPSGKYALCFSTSDSFEKVAAFYKKQANLKAGMHIASDGMSSAAFCPKEQEGCPGMLNGIDVTLNSPWSSNVNMPLNAKASDYENKGVLIRIYNKDAQMKQYNQK